MELTNSQIDSNLSSASTITSKYCQKYLIDCLDSLSDAIREHSIFSNSRAEEFRKETEILRNKLNSNNNSLDLNVCLIGITGSGKRYFCGLSK